MLLDDDAENVVAAVYNVREIFQTGLDETNRIRGRVTMIMMLTEAERPAQGLVAVDDEKVETRKRFEYLDAAQG